MKPVTTVHSNEAWKKSGDKNSFPWQYAVNQIRMTLWRDSCLTFAVHSQKKEENDDGDGKTKRSFGKQTSDENCSPRVVVDCKITLTGWNWSSWWEHELVNEELALFFCSWINNKEVPMPKISLSIYIYTHSLPLVFSSFPRWDRVCNGPCTSNSRWAALYEMGLLAGPCYFAVHAWITATKGFWAWHY